jgi:NTE family protein
MGLASHVPEEERRSDRIKALESYGCVTRTHVVRMIAPSLEGEDHTKDIDFSRGASGSAAGRHDARRVLESKPWNGEFDPMEGILLHEVERGVMTTQGH